MLAMCHKPAADKTAAAPTAALTVVQVQVAEGQWPDIVKATGPIAAWQEAVIGAEIAGQRLTEVTANVGDEVKKGQVLAKFNPATLQAERAELQANWVQADANAQRALRVKESGALSASQVENYVNLAAVAKARLDAKNLQLKYTQVVAPDDGVISARSATLGAVAGSGQELFRLIRQNRLEWRGELTAEQLARIAPGQPVKLTLPDGSEAEAVVRQLAPALDAGSRMGTVYADVAAGSAARAGMYGEGRIELAARSALIVPAKSVVLRDGHSYVFKLKPVAATGTAKAVQQEVTVGRTEGDDTEVVSGLAAGDAVAGQGAGFLNEGDTVRVVAAPVAKSRVSSTAPKLAVPEKE
jgi:RND family efflux transporter MFP subunit